MSAFLKYLKVQILKISQLSTNHGGVSVGFCQKKPWIRHCLKFYTGLKNNEIFKILCFYLFKKASDMYALLQGYY